MALKNTNERYNYIYGNNARKVDRRIELDGGTSPRKLNPEPQHKKKKKSRVWSVDAFDWKFTLMAVVALFVISVGCFYYIGEISRMTNMATQIRALKSEKTKLLSEQVAMQSELDKAINLDKIQEYAESHLDMVFPDHDDILYYYQDSSDYFRQYESVD